MTIEDVKQAIRNVPDFPKQGIMFKDITTALKNPKMFAFIVDTLYENFKDLGITKIACVESRGFIVGGALAYKIGAGFIPIRKPGKLPADKYSIEYELEYGLDKLEVHKDAFCQEDIVLIHDDLLATGGTANATYKLLKQFPVNTMYFSFLCELSYLEGRKHLPQAISAYSLFSF